MDKTGKIVEDNLDEYERRYGYHLHRNLKVMCLAKFLDKIKNETKFIHIESFNIIGELNKTLQSSQGLFEHFKTIEIKIITNGKVNENKLDFYLKSENIPILWKKHYSKISFDGYYKHNQDCSERHFQVFT